MSESRHRDRAENQGAIDLLSELVPFYLWRYNGAMQIVNFPFQQNQPHQVGANGECPHCSPTISYFHPIANYFENLSSGAQRVVSAARCESCKKFVLVIGEKAHGSPQYSLVAVYPLGKPNDAVAEEVKQAAKDVAQDYAEALRCHWIKSYRASVVMCRRAIQSSAIALKASGGRLIDQIDDLFKTGKVTESLKEFAHEIRLTGNDGAHPDKDGLNAVTEKDSADIIEFTKEFLNYIYVMPAKLKARKTPPVAASAPKTP
jgi:hypothetical protein